MAQRKTVPATIDLNPHPDDVFDEPGTDLETVPAQPTEEDRLIEMVQAQLGENASDAQGSVTIMKFNPDLGKNEWVDKMSASEFEKNSVPYIAKNYGAGVYEIMVYGSNKKIVSRHKIPISESAKILREPEKGAVSAEVRALVENQARLQELIQTLAATVATAPAPQTPPTESRMQFFQEMQMMRELFGGRDVPQQSQVNPLDMFRSMAEMFKEMQPAGDGETSLIQQITQFVDKMGPHLSKAIEAAKNQQQNAPAALPDPSTVQKPAQPQQLKPAPVNPEANPEMFQSMMIRKYLNFFMEAAQNDEPTEPYAEMIMAKVPFETAQEWCAKDSLAETLAKYHPGVLSNRDWFEKLKENVSEIVTEVLHAEKEEAEKDATENATGTIAVPAPTEIKETPAEPEGAAPA